MTKDPQSRVPRVAFVVDLGDAQTQREEVARLHHLIQLFRTHRIPTTWAIGNAQRAELLGQENLTVNSDSVALSIGAEWITRRGSSKLFRSKLASQITNLHNACGLTMEIVMGDSHALRGFAYLLAEQGVRAIVLTTQAGGIESPPKSLPLGIWQFTPSVRIPQPGRFLRPMFSRLASAGQLLDRPVGSTSLIVIDSAQLGHLGPRKLQQMEKFVRDVAWAASRDQLILTTIGQYAKELASDAAVQPQCSILRVAA